MVALFSHVLKNPASKVSIQYGCLSNWYQAEFDYVYHFANSEQYMMYHKVMLCLQLVFFNDCPFSLRHGKNAAIRKNFRYTS